MLCTKVANTFQKNPELCIKAKVKATFLAKEKTISQEGADLVPLHAVMESQTVICRKSSIIGQIPVRYEMYCYIFCQYEMHMSLVTLLKKKRLFY